MRRYGCALSGERIGGRCTEVVIGIAGKSCAGKDTVANILGRHGYSLIDVDHIGATALEKRRDLVLTRFGSAILNRNGEIDRAFLARHVFSNPNERRALEAIVHPLMISIVEQEVAKNSGHRIAINAALLFYMRLHRFCDRVLWITALLPLRIQRAMTRDRLPIGQIIRRISSQRHLAPQPWAKKVDIDTVYNNGGTKYLEPQLRSLGLL